MQKSCAACFQNEVYATMCRSRPFDLSVSVLQVKVRRRGSDTKFVASVLAVGTECDIGEATWGALCADVLFVSMHFDGSRG